MSIKTDKMTEDQRHRNWSLFKAAITSAKERSILSYLDEQGIAVEKKGDLYLCSSPFSEDNNWSFVIYPRTNSFNDFSTDKGGDIISLVMELEKIGFYSAVRRINEGNYSKAKLEDFQEEKKVFNLGAYLTYDKAEQVAIRKYALSRGISEGYKPGVFFSKDAGEWVRHPSILFEHHDENMKTVGCKLRTINNDAEDRFRARGELGYYVLENFIDNTFSDPTVYLIESETSANSLWMFFKAINHNAVVISCGAVSAVPAYIPKRYSDYDLKIIVDYDGDENLYQQRCESYSHLGGEHIRLILPKGEDLNSLWTKKKVKLISNLII